MTTIDQLIAVNERERAKLTAILAQSAAEREQRQMNKLQQPQAQ